MIVLDNLNPDIINRNELETYFPVELLKKTRQQVVITPQERHFFLESEKNFYIDGFSDEEATKFLLLGSPEVPSLDSVIARKNLMQEFNKLPLGLQCAKLYLWSHPHLSVDEYLELIKDEEAVSVLEDDEEKLIKKHDGYEKAYGTQRAAILYSIKKLSTKAQYLLKCCAFLNANNIPFELIRGLLSQKFKLSDNLALAERAVLAEYSDSSLVLLSQQIERFTMHGVVQTAVKSQVSKEEERMIVDELLKYFISVHYLRHINRIKELCKNGSIQPTQKSRLLQKVLKLRYFLVMKQV